MALDGVFSVVPNSSYVISASGGGSPGVFTPFAFATAAMGDVWGEVLAGPVFAGVTAGVFADFGVLSFNTTCLGTYAFSERACTSLTMVYSLTSPTTTNFTSTSTVTITARNAAGTQVAQAVQSVSASDVGVNKTISLALGDQSIASVVVSAYLGASWSFLGSANVAGYGFNFRQFFIVETSGGGGGGGDEECPCDWLAINPVPGGTWDLQTGSCAEFTLAPLPATTWTKRGCP